MTLSVPSQYEERLSRHAARLGISTDDLLGQLLEQSLQGEPAPAGALTAARYRALLDAQTDLLCRYTPDTILTYVNPAYCRHYGQSEKDLLGKSFLPLARPEDEERIRARIAEVVTDPSPQMREYWSADVNGNSTYMLWVDYGVVDSEGKVTEIQAVGRDLTAHKANEEQALLAQELRLELTKEREMIEIKSQMISTLSHEFRTPLTVIQTSLDILERYMPRLSPQQMVERFDIIRGQVRHMVTLMEDLLTLGRLERNRIKLELQPTDIELLCLRLCDDILLTDQNQHNLRFDSSAGLNDFFTDRLLIERIVVNLVSNALKYSAPHTTVSLDLRRDQEKLVIRVGDEGIGIPEDDVPHLFEPFFRAGNVGRALGTGLGLAIVKQAVDVLGGEITVKSHPGTGTIFTVTLPEVPAGEVVAN
ncbi:MAG: PAS domain-containing sensor histidine kinase [Chloroflexi bacterium]|nr:PAS domain-containing sensor histidine kinase [Chloroflexota bacterium]